MKKPTVAQEYALLDYLLHPLMERSKPFERLVDLLDAGEPWTRAQNLQGSAVAYVLAGLRRHLPDRPIVVVAPGLERAEETYDDLLFFRVPEVYHFPKWETLPYDEEEPHLEILAKHLDAFRALGELRDMERRPAHSGKPTHVRGEISVAPPILVTSIDALLHKVLPLGVVERLTVRIAWGARIDTENLALRLTDSGYEREPLVEARGEFSIRGNIIDVYPPNADSPIRIDLFGDEIESIRQFDVATQRSTDDFGTDAVLDLMPARLREPMFDLLEHGENLALLLDALPADTLFFLDEHDRFPERAEHFHGATQRQFRDVFGGHADLPEPEHLIVPLSTVEKRLSSFQVISHSILPPDPDRPKTPSLSFLSAGYSHLPNDLSAWLSLIRHQQAEDYQVTVLCDNDGQIQRFDEVLREHELAARPVYPADEDHSRFRVRSVAEGYPDVVLLSGHLTAGFHFSDIHVSFITDREVFGRYKRRHTYRRLFKGAPLASTSEIKRGDYVVHVEHGIGRFLGMRQQEIDGRLVDLLELEYAEGNKLLVPVDKIRYVQKFSGTDAAPPALDKLGSSRWVRRREKSREDIEKMAKELLDLYARRELAERDPFPPDKGQQAEFEASFLYRETPDQLSAIEQVKTDMECARPMDRLVCGDVGYGKTEVAIRAIFKCVLEGRQAAILVPTTILALQHYNTLRERFAGYPIRVEMLSRFRSSKEQKSIVQQMADGTVQVVVGTHRLLSKDIAFADLGLVVVDEEQRFGVRHKERLKDLRTSVDFLTLTATPIPRTLYMALSGLRDLSIINTPPPDRHPIKTRIIHWQEDQIAEALLRELNRGGQVFFVHNRIHNIEDIVTQLRKIVPHARIAIGHGALSEKELEQVMLEFIDRKFDILVSTTIIENGLDIPNCNTIVINRADAFGLAQLYQLRGRVGREHRHAYAYLIVPQGQMITESAVKRLAAIEEFTELGVGFNIAMRDMEIRGTGSILGAQQHGTIDQIGFELYCEMLEDAVHRLKGEETVRHADVEIKWKTDATIPPTYVPVESQRIAFYKRLAAENTLEGLDDLAAELTDRFGEPPRPVQALFRIARLRLLAANLEIEAVAETPIGARLVLGKEAAEDLAVLLDAARGGVQGFRGFRHLGSGEIEIGLSAAGAPAPPAGSRGDRTAGDGTARLEALLALLLAL